ncbi:secretin and TonB N-terminal domain-containing protein, partial [bacterium]|nr:secretin and TonB N-terminal domain-containing protein [bacterium]
KMANINERRNRFVKETLLGDKEREAEVIGKAIFPADEKIDVEKPTRRLMHLSDNLVSGKLKTKISVDFREVDFSYIINFIAEQTGVNIVVDSNVKQDKKVTIKLKDMEVEKILKYMLKSYGLKYRIEGDIVWISSPEQLEVEDLETKVFFLNYASNLFAEFAGSASSQGGLGGAQEIDKIVTVKELIENAVSWPSSSKITLDERSGAIIVTNTPSNLRTIENILYNIDVSPMQIEIESRFLEVDITNLKEFGIDWSTKSAIGKDVQLNPNSTIGYSAFTRATEGLNLAIEGVLTKPQFEATIHALSENNKTKTLSAPKVATTNNRMARLEVVDEWIYPTSYEAQLVQEDINGDGDYDDAGETKTVNVPKTFATRNVGIILHVTPSVGIDQETISLALVPEVSEAVGDFFEYSGEVKLPKFTSRNLSTNIMVKNGETVVLGGMVKETKSKRDTKVPLLGDLPILGNLFKKKVDSIERSNLLIFVTATIITEKGEKFVFAKES